MYVVLSALGLLSPVLKIGGLESVPVILIPANQTINPIQWEIAVPTTPAVGPPWAALTKLLLLLLLLPMTPSTPFSGLAATTAFSLRSRSLSRIQLYAFLTDSLPFHYPTYIISLRIL